MKKQILLFAFLFIGIMAKAQFGVQYIHSPYFKTTGSYELPSQLGTDFKHASINLIGQQFYFGNSAISANSLYNYQAWLLRPEDFMQEGQSEGQFNTYAAINIANDFIGTRSSQSFIAGMRTYSPLSVAFKLKTKVDGERIELATFSIRNNVRVASNFTVGNGIFKLIRDGNGPYVGETINLGGYYPNFHAYSEWVIGAAIPVIDLDFVKIRGGFNAKLLTGIAAIYTERSDIEMTTSPDARSIVFDVDYKINLSAVGLSVGDTSLDFNGNGIGPRVVTDGAGNGIGIDFGFTGEITDALKVSVALNDIGSIKYEENVVNYSGEGEIIYDGLLVDFFSLEDGFQINTDTVIEVFEPNRTRSDFNVPLPTRLVLNGQYGMNKTEKNGKEYFKHTFHLTYIQGFNRAAGNTRYPFINVAYHYQLGNFLNLGVNTGYGALYGTNIGAHIGLRGGPFRLGIGSNTTLGFLAPSAAKGADFYFNMGFAF